MADRGLSCRCPAIQLVVSQPANMQWRSACCRKVQTCAGDEANGVVARLRVLPEVDVGVIEDV